MNWHTTSSLATSQIQSVLITVVDSFSGTLWGGPKTGGGEGISSGLISLDLNTADMMGEVVHIIIHLPFCLGDSCSQS